MANIYKSSEHYFSAGGTVTLITAPAQSIVNSIIVNGYVSGTVTVNLEKLGGTSRVIFKVSTDGELTSGPLILEEGDKLNVVGLAGITAVASYVYTGTEVTGMSISGLTDVDTTGAVSGDALIYNGGTGQWEPLAGGAGGVTSVNGDAGPAVTLDAGDIFYQAGVTVFQKISDNTTGIASNANDIDNLEATVSSHSSLISANTAAISSNDTDIAAIQGDITGLDTAVSANTSNIAANAANIASNDTDIAAIQGDIVTIQGDITGLDAAVSSNTTNIAANAANISSNDSDIAAIQGDITGLDAAVSSNTTNIATNAANISSNDSDIAANASAIADLENGVGNVTAFNTLTGDVSISAGTNITFNTVGNDIEISASGGGGGGGGGAVDDVNGLTGAIDIVSTDLDLLTVAVDAVNNEIELTPILPRTMLEDVKNVSGGALTKGMALHITGSTGNEAQVIKADAASGLAAHLVLNENLPNNGDTGKAVAVGFINNVSVSDTTNFQAGTEVYLGNAGAFTHIKPTGTSIVQYLGVVLNASTPSGAGTISGNIQNLGIENQLPNLTQDYAWVGDANGVPQEVAINSFSPWSTTGANVYYNAGNVGIGVNTPQENLHVFSSDAPSALFQSDVPYALISFMDEATTNASTVSIGAEENDMVFKAGSNYHMVLTDTGKVGIGNTSPNHKLDVSGGDISLPLGNYLRFENQLGLTKTSNGAMELFGGTSSTAGGFNFNTWNGSYYPTTFAIRNNGNVGIGTTTPTEQLTLTQNAEIAGTVDAKGYLYDYNSDAGTTTYRGDIIKLGTTATTAGELYAWSGTNWVLADADSESTARSLLAIATATTSDKGMLINGYYRMASSYSAGQLYMSATAGGVTSTQPSTTGQFVRVLGHGLGSNIIRFNPSNDYFTVE